MSSTLRPASQLDELLRARGLITEDQLAEARLQASQRGRSVGRVLIELGFVTESGLVAILAEQLGLEFVDL
ncbi:MAG: type II secretion system protein GspE, partial [Actinomycetota bacterium]